MYRQYRLWVPNAELTCWLETDARLKPGARLTLKEIPDRVWVVTEAYRIELPDPPLTKWQAGGLM